MEKTETSLIDRLHGSLMGVYIADAVASPVHWYYERDRLLADYGELKGYVQPKELFPSSLMNQKIAREGKIGEIINHNKLSRWKKEFHYHGTLQKGECTLEA